ncbi:MAG: hypothetical protein V4727_09570 [Verrucomicrobiota bacterium]
MKSPIFIALLSVILCASSRADVPKKVPFQTYSRLWTKSPFTKEREKTDLPIQKSPFDDYHLTGIAPVDGGYHIVISSKKDKAAKKIVIEPGTESRYKVVSVDRNSGERYGTTVTLTDGNFQGVVRFEPTLVVLNTPVTAKTINQAPPGFDPNQPNQPPNGQLNQPNNGQPNQPNNGKPNPNTPTRSRIVPPVKPAQNTPNQNPQTRPSRNR